MTTAVQQIPLDLSARPAMGREDFLASPANAAALGWIDRWPDWPAPALILSGAAGCGKTHLAAVWQERAQAALITPERLTQDSAETLAAAAEHLMIDGLDLWIGDPAAETTLFHLYNIIKEDQRSLLLTMRSTPSALDFAVKDLPQGCAPRHWR